jgi:hypothetical protein
MLLIERKGLTFRCKGVCGDLGLVSGEMGGALAYGQTFDRRRYHCDFRDIRYLCLDLNEPF